MNANAKPLTPRALRAVEILKAGGYFRKQLETQWKGGEKFMMRLRDENGRIVKGFGFQTYFELTDAHMLSWRECARSSVWPEEYILREEKKV